MLRDDVLGLHGLHNRIAHHEPIHAVNLEGLHDQALAVAGYIDPAAQAWAARLSRVPAVLADRPSV